jgi:hypothetical protein
VSTSELELGVGAPPGHDPRWSAFMRVCGRRGFSPTARKRVHRLVVVDVRPEQVPTAGQIFDHPTERYGREAGVEIVGVGPALPALDQRSFERGGEANPDPQAKLHERGQYRRSGRVGSVRQVVVDSCLPSAAALSEGDLAVLRIERSGGTSIFSLLAATGEVEEPFNLDDDAAVSFSDEPIPVSVAESLDARRAAGAGIVVPPLTVPLAS